MMDAESIDYRKLTIEEFLHKANSAEPVPGGGSVSALTGALASSMGQMVLNLTIGKEKYKQFEADCKAGLRSLEKAQKMMLQLMDEDIAAFGEYSNVRKLEKDDATRPSKMAAAVQTCIAVPQEICAVALAMLEDMDRIKEKANVFLLSDLGVAAILAAATVKAAAFNIKANLSSIKDAGQIEKLKGEIRHDEDKSQQILNSIEKFLAAKF
jgi:formiminotetrahydrofolate cyclodeaminase